MLLAEAHVGGFSRVYYNLITPPIFAITSDRIVDSHSRKRLGKGTNPLRVIQIDNPLLLTHNHDDI